MCMTLEPYCQREKLLTMAYFPGEDRENEREKESATAFFHLAAFLSLPYPSSIVVPINLHEHKHSLA